MSSIVVRPITEDDVPGAAAALVEVHATDGYPVEGVARPEAWVRPAGVLCAWVAEREGEERIGVLARLFVVRDARRHAAGERLMRAAMDYAEENALRLVLDVMTKDTAAIRLYERLGWQHIGEVAHHFGAGEQFPAVCYVWPAT